MPRWRDHRLTHTGGVAARLDAMLSDQAISRDQMTQRKKEIAKEREALRLREQAWRGSWGGSAPLLPFLPVPTASNSYLVVVALSVSAEGGRSPHTSALKATLVTGSRVLFGQTISAGSTPLRNDLR